MAIAVISLHRAPEDGGDAIFWATIPDDANWQCPVQPPATGAPMILSLGWSKPPPSDEDYRRQGYYLDAIGACCRQVVAAGESTGETPASRLARQILEIMGQSPGSAGPSG